MKPSIGQSHWVDVLHSKTLLGRLPRAPLWLLPKGMIITVRGGVNKGCKWVVGAHVHGCWLGHYELRIQRLLARLVEPGMVALDIGANVGFYTLALSKLVGKGGAVWAFEPECRNVSLLLKHIELNRLTNVRVMQTAVGERSWVVAFQRSHNSAQGRMASSGIYRVPVMGLDELWRMGEIPIPDVMKIDVEGRNRRCLMAQGGS